MAEPTLSAAQVRSLARQGRVRPSPRFHANEHHIRLEDVEAALIRCTRVAKDLRTDLSGLARHPSGYVAYVFLSSTQKLRIDFDATVETDGIILWIVTAFRVSL